MIQYNPYSLEGKTILITGASSGIGAATAIECSKMGAKLVLTARNKDRLQSILDQLDGEGHSYVLAELTKQDEVEALVGSLSKINGAVLCAGIGYTLPFPFCSRQKMDEVFDINFFAPIELLRLLVKKKKMEKLFKYLNVEYNLCVAAVKCLELELSKYIAELVLEGICCVRSSSSNLTGLSIDCNIILNAGCGNTGALELLGIVCHLPLEAVNIVSSIKLICKSIPSSDMESLKT